MCSTDSGCPPTRASAPAATVAPKPPGRPWASRVTPKTSRGNTAHTDDMDQPTQKVTKCDPMKVAAPTSADASPSFSSRR